ncbi:hypothetical protein M4D56_01835 [Cytobacillus oceanisediminis]|uniref:hypothetical protein n=1 Tax=Cytobacillus oceanisediminis TaxID=665099 RepID=UPI00204228A7|nr:hypothetical protein [Cytobacillus oceanisediminis]MCM3527835.1 hypothetical protein [Cytobacillus oceanisediminis]
MGINNFDKYKNPRIVKNEANRNLNDFTRTAEVFTSYGSNEKLLTNIQDMRNNLNHLLTSGRVAKDEFEHNMLESALKQAVDIQLKTQRSMDDIVNFYSAYTNFQDISKRMGGDY